MDEIFSTLLPMFLLGAMRSISLLGVMPLSKSYFPNQFVRIAPYCWLSESGSAGIEDEMPQIKILKVIF